MIDLRHYDDSHDDSIVTFDIVIDTDDGRAWWRWNDVEEFGTDGEIGEWVGPFVNEIAASNDAHITLC